MIDKKDVILCGMYDKTCIPHEKDKLYKGIVPENVKEFKLEESEDGLTCATFSRKDFPLNKKDGSEQNYYGWYILTPVYRELLFLNENNGASMNVDYLKLKYDNGKDIIISKDGVEYYVYGKFNIAKTSNNWSLKVTYL